MNPYEYVMERSQDATDTLDVFGETVNNMTERSYPNTYRGMIIWSDLTPLVTGQPTGYPANWYEWHKRCLIVRPTGGELLYHDGVTYSTATALPKDASVTAAKLAALSVTLAKLSSAGASGDGQVLITSGTGFIFASINSAITSVAINKIAGGGAGTQFLKSVAGVNAWADFNSAAIVALFSANQFPVVNLAFGTSDQVLGTNNAGTAVAWDSVINKIAAGALLISKLATTGGTLNQSIRVGASGFEYYTPSAGLAGVNTYQYRGSFATLPASGVAATPVSHGLAGRPQRVTAHFECVTAELGYVAGNSVLFSTLKLNSGAGSADYGDAFDLVWDASTVGLIGVSSAADKLLPHKTTGVVSVATIANWKLVFVADYYA